MNSKIDVISLVNIINYHFLLVGPVSESKDITLASGSFFFMD